MTTAKLPKKTTAKYLRELWNVNVACQWYSEWGNYYNLINKFPAGLFDARGYVIIGTEDEYNNSTYLKIGKRLNVPRRISQMPGYVLVVPDENLTDLDLVNLEMEAEEGRERLMKHLIRERNKTVISQKKEQVRASGKPLACEICGFIFAEKYSGPGADYCEVHHLLPLAGEKQVRNTRNQDLAIVCANCHRVIHRRNPPFTMEEMRQMLIVPGGQ